MTASGKHRPMGARELVLLALLGALLLVTKLALAWLPNIEPVSLLVLIAESGQFFLLHPADYRSVNRHCARIRFVKRSHDL